MDKIDMRVVGRVVKPHGVRGEILIEPRTDFPEVRFAADATVQAVLPGGSERVLTIASVRPHSGRLLVFFAGINDRDQAEQLRGAVLSADLTPLPASEDPDEFYDHELEGLAVFTVDGTHVGTLRNITHGVGNDLLVIDREDSSQALIPFVKQLVPEINIAAGRIIVDPPPGLLPESGNS